MHQIVYINRHGRFRGNCYHFEKYRCLSLVEMTADVFLGQTLNQVIWTGKAEIGRNMRRRCQIS